MGGTPDEPAKRKRGFNQHVYCDFIFVVFLAVCVPDSPLSSSLLSPSSTAFSRLLRDLLLVLKFLSRFLCSWYVIGGLSGPMCTGRGVP